MMMKSKQVQILAISGSLKASSSNSIIINQISKFSTDDVSFIIYEGLEALPQFNPDKEAGNDAVSGFRDLLRSCDGLIISTPEYAFGVPGALKNALDWTVSSGELNEKPVIAISASPLYGGGEKALASLLLTLSALGTKMNNLSSLSIANISKKVAGGKISDDNTLNDLRNLYDQLMQTISSEQLE